MWLKSGTVVFAHFALGAVDHIFYNDSLKNIKYKYKWYCFRLASVAYNHKLL